MSICKKARVAALVNIKLLTCMGSKETGTKFCEHESGVTEHEDAINKRESAITKHEGIVTIYGSKETIRKIKCTQIKLDLPFLTLPHCNG